VAATAAPPTAQRAARRLSDPILDIEVTHFRF
jgi:hypothetical protein